MKRRKTECKMFSMKFRLYPSFEQVKLLQDTFFIYNQAYNITINKLKEYYDNKEKFPSTNNLRKEVQVILEQRKLKYNSKIVQFAVDNCKNNYFKSQIPNYKTSRNLANKERSFIIDNQSFKLVQNSKNSSYIQLFREKIKLNLHKNMDETVFKAKMVSIKKNNCNQWFAVLTFDIINEDKFKQLNYNKFENKNEKLCGIDTNKDNITLHINRFSPKIQEKLKKLNKGQLKSKQHTLINDKSTIDYISIDLENTVNDIEYKYHKNYAKKIECETVLSKIYEKYKNLIIEEYKKEYGKNYVFELYKTYTNKDNKVCIKINPKNKKPEFTKVVLEKIIKLLKENKNDYKEYLKNYYKKNKLRLKTNNIKQDKINKTNNLLMSCFDTFIIEKLETKKMMNKAKKEENKILRKKLQSSQLAKYISMITLGTRLYEKQLIKVAAPFTSSICHYCGNIHNSEDKKTWRPVQNVFICQSCKNCYNADENAATNITMQGLALLNKETRDLSHV